MRHLLIAAFTLIAIPSSGLPLQAAEAPLHDAVQDAALMNADWAQLRRGGAVRRGFVARGPRGGAIAGRTTAARPGVRPIRPVRPVPVPVRPVVNPAWRRPAVYWWRPGAAVAAGAALGFVTAAAATAYANSQPPAPGYCWFYTNPQRTAGFWDVCPR